MIKQKLLISVLLLAVLISTMAIASRNHSQNDGHKDDSYRGTGYTWGVNPDETPGPDPKQSNKNSLVPSTDSQTDGNGKNSSPHFRRKKKQ